MFGNVDLDDVFALANHPVGFIEEWLGCKPWEKQRMVCESIVTNKNTAVRSGHGVGKTTVAAWIALWWLFTRPYGAVITTAPSGRQVNELLWKEVRKAYKNARKPLGGELLPKAPKITVDDDWLMIGFSTDNDVNFQGWHSPGGTLVIFDEAPGVDPGIWEVVKGVLVEEHDRFLAIGNPVEPAGPFYDLFTKPGLANTIHISSFDVPNVIEGKSIIPGLATREWVEERRREWGEDSPMWSSRVMGAFPDADDRTLVPISWVDEAVARWHRYTDHGVWRTQPVCHLGLDVARKGMDSSVVAEFYPTLGVKKLHKFPKQDIVQTTGMARVLFDDTGAEEIRVDADGIGAGVYDNLIALMGDGPVVEMRGGMRSELDPTRFANRRSEWFWRLRELLDPEGDFPIALPPDDLLRAQLTGMRWELTLNGQIKLETKDKMADRGMKSPDEADAVAYAAAPMDDRFVIEDHLRAMARM